MKLKKSMESYNVKSLKGIQSGVEKMKKHCDILEYMCLSLEKEISDARLEGFDDINCDRAEEIIQRYIQGTKEARLEYKELSESVKEYIDKINDIWGCWS